jgi:hypothetical protein
VVPVELQAIGRYRKSVTATEFLKNGFDKVIRGA